MAVRGFLPSLTQHLFVCNFLNKFPSYGKKCRSRCKKLDTLRGNESSVLSKNFREKWYSKISSNQSRRKLKEILEVGQEVP